MHDGVSHDVRWMQFAAKQIFWFHLFSRNRSGGAIFILESRQRYPRLIMIRANGPCNLFSFLLLSLCGDAQPIVSNSRFWCQCFHLRFCRLTL